MGGLVQDNQSQALPSASMSRTEIVSVRDCIKPRKTPQEPGWGQPLVVPPSQVAHLDLIAIPLD